MNVKPWNHKSHPSAFHLVVPPCFGHLKNISDSATPENEDHKSGKYAQFGCWQCLHTNSLPQNFGANTIHAYVEFGSCYKPHFDSSSFNPHLWSSCLTSHESKFKKIEHSKVS